MNTIISLFLASIGYKASQCFSTPPCILGNPLVPITQIFIYQQMSLPCAILHLFLKIHQMGFQGLRTIS